MENACQVIEFVARSLVVSVSLSLMAILPAIRRCRSIDDEEENLSEFKLEPN